MKDGVDSRRFEQVEQLEKRRDLLRAKIAETTLRLPAHSAKPPVMIELFSLEDELESVLKKLVSLGLSE